MFLRVEVIADYGDTVMVRGATPIAYGSRGRMMDMPPMVIVAKADLVEDHPIVQPTKSVGRSSGMASPDLATSPSRDLAASPEATPC